MSFTFVPMTEDYARTIVDGWRYGGEYAAYDYVHEAEHILDRTGWGSGIFAVLGGGGELVGELSIEFFDEEENPTEYDEYGDSALINSRQLWLGFGLRPDLTGRGLGGSFVSDCLDFALRQTGYQGEYVRLGVAAFNQRAIKVYERAGFEPFQQAEGEIGGRTFAISYMRKRLRAA